jgi:hypothetical protein
MSDSTCYIERSAVREILIAADGINNDTTGDLLKEVDALKIFTADDFMRVLAARPPSDSYEGELIERVEDILRAKKTVSYPSSAAAEYVREHLQALLVEYLKLRKKTSLPCPTDCDCTADCERF